jgi:hypothetical protein
MHIYIIYIYIYILPVLIFVRQDWSPFPILLVPPLTLSLLLETHCAAVHHHRQDPQPHLEEAQPQPSCLGLGFKQVAGNVLVVGHLGSLKGLITLNAQLHTESPMTSVCPARWSSALAWWPWRCTCQIGCLWSCPRYENQAQQIKAGWWWAGRQTEHAALSLLPCWAAAESNVCALRIQFCEVIFTISYTTE